MADQEHVELEQVPLKFDTDAPAQDPSKTDEHVVAEKKLEKREGGRKWLFFSSTKKKHVMDDDGKPIEVTTTTETTTVTTAKPKTATLTRWFKKDAEGGGCMKSKKPKGEDGHDAAAAMSIGINMLDRDERALNEHVKLSFEDIYGEPDTMHSWDCVWRLTYRIFTWSRCFFYRLFALLLAIPSAIVFGVLFALLTVINIFACTPFGRALTIPAIWIAKTWNFIVRSLFDPLFRSFGLCCGGITVRRYGGMSSDPTADLI